MTKIQKNISHSQEKKNVLKNTAKNANSLDKLAQLRNSNQSVSKQGEKNTPVSLCKRARAKYFTNSYVIPLSMQKSPLQKSYNNTIFGCSNEIHQEGNKLTTHYCNNRWCIVCNRIRTAKLINGYSEVLQNLNDKHFVTLTIPNVDGIVLRETIGLMTKKFTLIKDRLRKKQIKLQGIRKTEVTFSEKRKNFHPHFHLIIAGKLNAEYIVDTWLEMFPDSVRKAQNIRKINKDDELEAMIELFKYFTKIVTKKSVYIKALDTIFQSMYGLRTFQSFGIKKIVSEDVDEIDSQIYDELQKAERNWTWVEHDWVDRMTGEYLTGYTPDNDNLRNIKIIGG